MNVDSSILDLLMLWCLFLTLILPEELELANFEGANLFLWLSGLISPAFEWLLVLFLDFLFLICSKINRI
jgi:hypothetical protein